MAGQLIASESPQLLIIFSSSRSHSKTKRKDSSNTCEYVLIEKFPKRITLINIDCIHHTLFQYYFIQEQFIFCHEVVRQMARHGITRVPANIFPRWEKRKCMRIKEGNDSDMFNFWLKNHSMEEWDCNHNLMIFAGIEWLLFIIHNMIFRCNHESRCTAYTNKPVILPVGITIISCS